MDQPKLKNLYMFLSLGWSMKKPKYFTYKNFALTCRILFECTSMTYKYEYMV